MEGGANHMSWRAGHHILWREAGGEGHYILWRGGAYSYRGGRGTKVFMEGSMEGGGIIVEGRGILYRAYPTPQINAQAFKLFSNTIA